MSKLPLNIEMCEKNSIINGLYNLTMSDFN